MTQIKSEFNPVCELIKIQVLNAHSWTTHQLESHSGKLGILLKNKHRIWATFAIKEIEEAAPKYLCDLAAVNGYSKDFSTELTPHA